MGRSFGYELVSKILNGANVRDALFESLDAFRNNADYENINTEHEFMGFNGTLAAFSPKLKTISHNPHYTTYSFQVYCPDLIGSVYDSDDPHPMEVTIHLDSKTNPDLTPFKDLLAKSYQDGLDIRSALRYLFADGESVFKPIQVKHLWRNSK